MKKILFLLLTASVMLTISCDNKDDDEKASIPDSQQYLFELRYYNYAWGFRCFGFFINRDGQIIKYSPDSDEGLIIEYSEDTEKINESDLSKIYTCNPKMIGGVDETTLRENISLVKSALKGELIYEGFCQDAGHHLYFAFSYDEATGEYSPILLHQAGDNILISTSPEADKLYWWLRGLASALTSTDTDFYLFDYCDVEAPSVPRLPAPAF